MRNLMIYFLAFAGTLSLVSCTHEDKQAAENFVIRDRSSGNLKRLKDSITEEIIKHNDRPGLLVIRAKILEAQGKIPAAVEDMENALAKDSTRAYFQFYMGTLYAEVPYMKGAVRAYEKALALSPHDKLTMLAIGKTYYTLKKHEESFKYLNMAIKEDKFMPEPYFYRGLNFREMGQMDNAIRSLQTAIEIKPQDFDAQLLMGVIFAERKDPKALDYYKNALNLNPSHTGALYDRGMYYQNMDSFSLAMKDYEQIIMIDPEHKDAHYNLGALYFLKKNYVEALSHFNKVISLDPDNASAYDGRSLTYKAMGKTREAKEDEEKYESLVKEKKEKSRS